VTAYEIALFAGSYLLGGAFVAAAVYAAATGRDIQAFEQLRTTDPKRFRNLRRVAMFNCPLITIMCLCFVVGSPWIAMHPTGGVLFVIAALPIFVAFLWLSVRWFQWSVRTAP